MMLANHVNDKLVITNKEAKVAIFVQEKKIFKDLARIKLYNNLEVVYLPIMETGNEKKVFGFPTTLSQPSPALLSPIRLLRKHNNSLPKWQNLPNPNLKSQPQVPPKRHLL